MFKLMQKKSLELLLAQQKAADNNGASAAAAPSSSASASSGGGNGTKEEASGRGDGRGLDGPCNGGPVEASMRHKLTDALSPLQLSIRNESDRHAGHAGHVGSAAGTGETHFSVELVSKEFEGLRRASEGLTGHVAPRCP